MVHHILGMCVGALPGFPSSTLCLTRLEGEERCVGCRSRQHEGALAILRVQGL